MGFVDFLVPFAQNWGNPLFEAVVFTLSALSVLVAWYVVKHASRTSETKSPRLKVNA